ncbi:hypothetical protein E1A91_A05G156600v1 [Gossypium mustelinum]|uniref:TCP domain-containing protein n=1 Tax=Gossypium mustelinum TaxID=34275 RepID=A0A5D2Z651_GOSMU|nr:hypothetical protein E1A91_A05G156600v1 [Gossypium mustelinum]TYJ34256.1 hypothetical protein E1A91_A05G156600v1 [Gossypium mustelinum]TYJ34257.1 hypothetical protein E1A91_A05G156600v1 [Gossypium mustelinum]
MEIDEIQTQQGSKFSRVGNGRSEPSRMGQKGSDNHYPDDEEGREVMKRASANGGGGDALADTAAANRLRGWHHSSRIIRVSRASGGKDRHSKVWTSKGLRDRRVRLSVSTAIQFYDLQDRLGYDQPSKAIEWLIKEAADAIAELPSLNTSFPDTPKQLSDDGTEQGFDSAEVELDGDPNNYQQNQSQQHLSLSKSACSSTSETSKNSGLSLSRSENRVKARERARGRVAKEKGKEQETDIAHQQNVNPISQNSSFTELLTCGIGSVSNNHTSPSPTGSAHQNPRQWSATQMDYFTMGLLGPSSSRNQSSGFPGQMQQPQPTLMPPFTVSGENNQKLQHFSFVPNTDHMIPVATAQPVLGSDYNLNFAISSGIAGFNRGTLQSNSPPFLPHHLQRFSSIDGSPPVENHHHH